MNELVQVFNTAGIRYLLVGGQAMRLAGMPRFSMDWDFFIPPHDLENFARLNQVLGDELDVPLLPLGTRGENFIQTYQTRWGWFNFISVCRVCPGLMKRKNPPCPGPVKPAWWSNVCRESCCWRRSAPLAAPKTRRTSFTWKNYNDLENSERTSIRSIKPPSELRARLRDVWRIEKG